MANSKEHYQKTAAPQLMKELGYASVMQIPKFTKITINMGVGEALQDRKHMDNATKDLMAIAGQKPIVTRARKSIAGFKIRQGWPIGCKVTLRRDRMWEFLDRLTCIAIPRIRDFRGLSRKAFDGQGNYSMGIKESLVFPEITNMENIRGMDITITTTANNDEEGLALLLAMNFPLKER